MSAEKDMESVVAAIRDHFQDIESLLDEALKLVETSYSEGYDAGESAGYDRGYAQAEEDGDE